MNFKKVPRSDAIRIPDLKKKTAALEQKREDLIDALTGYCDKSPTLREAGVSMRRADTGAVYVETPFGTARTKNGWGVDQQKLVATLIFEREQIDSRDRTFWQPIFGFTVSESNAISSGAGGDGVSLELHWFQDELGQVFAETMMTIIHRIAAGPAD